MEKRSEIESRLRFIKARIRDSVTELSFAKGKIPSLPKHLAMPPPWALAAARKAWETGFAHLRTLRADEKSRTYGDAAELFGIYRRLVSYVQNPPTKIRDEESNERGLVTLRKSVARHISRKFLKFIARVERKFHSGIQVPTEEQLIEWATRYDKGITRGFLSPEGEVEALRKKQARIYYLIWLFWPKLRYRFTSPGLHRWLREEHGETEISDKTVEAVITQLRKDIDPTEIAKSFPGPFLGR